MHVVFIVDGLLRNFTLRINPDTSKVYSAKVVPFVKSSNASFDFEKPRVSITAFRNARLVHIEKLGTHTHTHQKSDLLRCELRF